MFVALRSISRSTQLSCVEVKQRSNFDVLFKTARNCTASYKCSLYDKTGGLRGLDARGNIYKHPRAKRKDVCGQGMEYPIASVQTSGILISARGHFLSKMAFGIVYCFSEVFSLLKDSRRKRCAILR